MWLYQALYSLPVPRRTPISPLACSPSCSPPTSGARQALYPWPGAGLDEFLFALTLSPQALRRTEPGHEEVFSGRVVEFYPGERREFSAHAGPQRASVEEALHRRGGEPFQGDVDDRPGRQLAPACRGKRPEREPHCGAAPVMA